MKAMCTLPNTLLAIFLIVSADHPDSGDSLLSVFWATTRPGPIHNVQVSIGSRLTVEERRFGF